MLDRRDYVACPNVIGRVIVLRFPFHIGPSGEMDDVGGLISRKDVENRLRIQKVTLNPDFFVLRNFRERDVQAEKLVVARSEQALDQVGSYEPTSARYHNLAHGTLITLLPLAAGI